MRSIANTCYWITLNGWLIFISTGSVAAQTLPDSVDVAYFIENWLSSIDLELEIDETVFQHLQDLIEVPLDLNTCTSEELAQLPWLDPILIGSFLRYRKEKGFIETVTELGNIPQWTSSDQAGILPFVRVDSTYINIRQRSQKKLFRFQKTQVVQQYSRRLDLPRGYGLPGDSIGFKGSPGSLYTRISTQLGPHLKARMVADKDAGERIAWQPAASTYGFDHISGAIEFKHSGIVKHVVIGDYGINLGQGLLFWRPHSNQRGLYPTRDPVKQHSGLMMTASREENAFYRGLAVQVGLRHSFSLLAFHSRRTIDANLDTSLATNVGITSFSTSGLHRTEREQAKKDRQHEIITGGELRWTTDRLRLGIAGYTSQYRFPFLTFDALYKRHTFSASQLKGIGIHGAFQTQTTYLFAALARSYPGAIATLAGILLKPADQFRILVLGRSYSPRYYTFHGHAFGKQRAAPQNEKGLYLGFNLVITPQLTLSGYADHYRFIWLRFNMPQPDSGHEHQLRMLYSPRKWVSLLWQYRGTHAEKSSTPNVVSNKVVQFNEKVTTHAFRHQLDFEFSERLSFRLRADAKFSSNKQQHDQGYAFAQDISYFPGEHTKLMIRFSQFDSDGGLTTLYFYENDIRYRYAVAALTGKGARNFLLFKHQLNNHFSVEARYAITRYERVRTMGSGLDSYSGKRIRDMHAQLIWHF